MNSILKGTATLFFFLISLNVNSQEFKTEVKVTKGLEYSYQTESFVDIIQSMGGQEIKVTNNSSSTYKYKVENVLNDGNVEVLGSIWDVKASTKAPMMDTTMSFTGRVTPVYKFVFNKYGNSLSKEKVDTTGAISANIGVSMDRNLSPAGLFCEFPEKNLKVGEKWVKTTSDSVPNMGGKLGLNIKTEYTLGGTEMLNGKQVQKVTFTSEIEMGGKAKMQGMDIFIEGTGVQSGTIMVDATSKVITENQSDTELDMNLAITGPQNMTIPTTQKIKTIQKLK
jgi:hypothetical protein